MLEHIGGVRRALTADDGFALLQPDLVAAFVKNNVKQVCVGGALRPGDLGENAEVFVLCGCFFLCRRLLAGRKGQQHHSPKKQGKESHLFLHEISP